MSLNLDFLKVRFTSTLSQNALIFTARSIWQITHGRVVLRHRWNLIWLIILDLEVEDLKRIKRVQIVEVSRRVCLHFLKERGDIGFILKGQLEQSLANHIFVESEAELDICDIVLRLSIVNKTSVLG